MINVSDSFKNAIKNSNREIFGYVDIKYQNNSYSTSVEQIPTVLPSFLDNGLLSGSKILKKYATLESNYTLLNGSFMVWNDNIIDENGYVSNDIFSDINDSTIVIENNSTTIATKGITIYFKENLPFSFNVTITDIDNNTYIDNVINNTSMVYQYIFNDEKYVSQIELEITSMEFPNNRIRIAYVDFNLSDLYEGNELVSFDIDENIDLFAESLPINTCVVNLNNYPDSHGENKFDVINPKGITKYLNDNVKVDPYIGVLTESNGIEYVHMGEFFLQSWNSDSNGNVTFRCENCISKIMNMNVEKDTGGFLGLVSPSNLNPYLTNLTGFTFDLYGWSGYDNYWLDNYNLGNWLLTRLPLFIISNRNLKVTRNNVVKLYDVGTTSIYKLPQNCLKEDVDYKTRVRLSSVEIQEPEDYSMQFFIETINAITDTHTMINNIDYVWYVQNKNMDLTGTFTYTSTTSASATLLDSNHRMIFVKYTGTPGDIVSINYSVNTYQEPNVTNNIFDKGYENSSKIKIDLSSCRISDANRKSIADSYFSLDKQYVVNAKTIGDPSVEVGDCISIQTRYKNVNDGYKDIIVTNQHFTYDGGLSCLLEGLGD